MGVADDFKIFRSSYIIGTDKISSIGSRYKEITKRLNKDFWDTDSESAHSLYVGSYGRDTAAKGVSDLDVGFQLPYEIYTKYNAYSSNGQSALLQAVRSSLQKRYQSSRIGGDGQVVVINFDDGVTFEVLPYFRNTDESWTFADSNGGGSWKTCNPRAEIAAVHTKNLAVNGNLKALCRMMRVWRDHKEVPISGALIDTLAYQFISTWQYRDKSFLYHDFMVRDFLLYMNQQDRDQTYWRMPGSGSYVYRSGAFGYKAGIDHKYAVAACDLQGDENTVARRTYWRIVFGTSYPK
jgi:hypothetical protein